jgi:SAM-dependent methyltransferase
VQTAEQASLYLNRLVAQAISPVVNAADSSAAAGTGAAGQALDLGCGVGGSATWLALELGISVTGVTNSEVQVQIARQRLSALGLVGRCRFIRANFMDLPPLGPFQAAWAIESFTHAPDPGRFFEQVAAQLDPGGRLVICDDFLAEPTEAILTRRNAAMYIRRFQQGWHVPNLLTADQAVDAAENAGFKVLASNDLTRWLRGFHPVILFLVSALTRLPLRWAYWQNLSGGAALQVCIRSGWTKYLSLVFER